MNLLIGAVTIGLILALLGLGVFISYRIYGILDLTADGSFGLGAAVVAALLVLEVHPLAATAIAAHVGWDRALGYGLKLPTGFKDTHLGRIGGLSRTSND